MPHPKNGCNGEVGTLAAAAPLRILLLAAPGSQILDLVGPFQLFTRASEILARSRPGTRPVYSLEVVTTEPKDDGARRLAEIGMMLPTQRQSAETDFAYPYSSHT